MATLDVNYYFHSFTLNAYMKTPERGLDSELLALKKSPWKYGFSLRFNKKNWLAEAGTDSPFTKHSRYTNILLSVYISSRKKEPAASTSVQVT